MGLSIGRLWRYVLTVTERAYFKSSVAHNNLGAVLVKQGELEEAVQHYQEALRILQGRSGAGGGAN